MKKHLFILAFIGLIFSAKAQLEISAMGGYFLGGSVDFYQGSFKMHDAPDYTIATSVPTAQGNYVELIYSFTNSTAELIPYRNSNYDYSTATLNTHYILIGSYQQIETGSIVEPFIGLNIGTAIYDYQYRNTSNVWRFAAGLTGGLKIDISKKIGIRLQGRLLMPMYFAGVGFYAGIGSGGTSSGLSLNSGALAIQGDFSGGLIFKLK